VITNLSQLFTNGISVLEKAKCENLTTAESQLYEKPSSSKKALPENPVVIQPHHTVGGNPATGKK